MFVEQDAQSRAPGLDTEAGADDETSLRRTADALRRNLRMQDVAGRWERKRLLLVLPEITLEGARALAARLLAEVKTHGTEVGRFTLPATASIGIAVMGNQPEQEVLLAAMNNPLSAQRNGGDRYVAD